MKYDLTKKRTRSAQRILDTFSQTMFTLLTEKSLDKINVNELCTLSNFPRATFYNYFNDKYDLVDYCWYLLISEMHLTDLQKLEPCTLSAACHFAFDQIYDLFTAHETLLTAINKNNQATGNLIMSFTTYARTTARQLFYQYFHGQKNNLPTELVADHVSNTILLLIEWIFIKKHALTKTQAHVYLENFLGDLT